VRVEAEIDLEEVLAQADLKAIISFLRYKYTDWQIIEHLKPSEILDYAKELNQEKRC